MHITSPPLLTSFYILRNHIVFPPCYDNGWESSMFNEWLEAGCRFRNILVTVNMRSSSIICSHIIVFQGSSAKCAPTEAQIYFGRVSAHLLAVCFVQMLVSLNKLCTDTGSASFGSGRGKLEDAAWAIFPTHLLSNSALSRLSCSSYSPSTAASFHHFPSPFRCEMYLYSEHRNMEKREQRKWHKQSNRIVSFSAVGYHIFLDKTRTTRSRQ